MILAPFIYDNTRLLLLSKTEKFPNGLANSSGHLGKHVIAHITPRVFATFDDRCVNIYMGPSAQKHSLDDFNADNFDHAGLGFIRGAQISVAPADLEGGPIGTAMAMTRRRACAVGARTIAISWRNISRATPPSSRKPKIFPMPTRPSISIPTCAISMACPRRASRMTGDVPNEMARAQFLLGKLEEIGRGMGAQHVWRGPLGNGMPGAHHEGGTRMGSDPKDSVVNRYGQTWDIPNLFVLGSSTHPDHERL